LDQRCYAVYCEARVRADLVVPSLVSTFGTLSREVLGRANFGQGLLEMTVPEVEAIMVLEP
jgi:hypothetical protein